LEVHAPHAPIHNWRDFFIHLLTITIGLLIALGLEGSVEWLHHRHLVDQARTDMHEEMKTNRGRLGANLSTVRADEERIAGDIKTLLEIRSGKKITHGSLDYTFAWSAFGDSAWKTAQSSSALVYMDFESQRTLAEVYGHQDLVSATWMQIQRNHALAISPLYINGGPNGMSTAEAQLTIQRSADLLMDLRTLEQLLEQLDKSYAEELGKL
jgi:hypothetical protein